MARNLDVGDLEVGRGLTLTDSGSAAAVVSLEAAGDAAVPS